MAAAPRTIVITVPAKSGLAFRKPTTVSIQGGATNQPASLQQQRLIRTAPIASAAVRVAAPVPPPTTTTTTTTFISATALGKRPSSDLENTDPFVVIQPPRKRERLTHLTPEEKLNRRKLKNRVAAQTARDRKKLRTNTLEESLEHLSTENQQLLAENARLKQRLSQLSAENTRLKRSTERVDSEDEKPPKIDNMAGGRSSDAFGSAASINAPLQWDQASRLPTQRLLALLMAYLTSICKESSTTCSAEPNSTTLRALNLIRSAQMSSTEQKTRRPLTQTQIQTLMEAWKALRRKRTAGCG